MKNKFKKLFYGWAYLDCTGTNKKEDTYFYRFSREIGQNNLRMMQSMSNFMLIISLFVIASTFTYFGEESLRKIYIVIVFLELVLLTVIRRFLQKDVSTKVCTALTTAHLFHMLIIGGYIGVFYCREETAIIFVVVLTISSMIFTLPTMLTVSIATICTFATIVASYYVKERYWFESDVLNGVAVLIFSFMFGWRVNRIRANEAFAQANVLRLNKELKNEITVRKQEQEELRLRLEQHQIIMDQTTDILFEWNIRKDTLIFSSNWRKKFGYDPIEDKISGRIPLSKNIHVEDMPAFVTIMKDTAAGKAYSETEFRIKDSSGRYRWCRIRATAQFDDDGRAIKAVGVILDINKEKHEKQNLIKMAQRDALTGIYNKAATNATVMRRMKDFDFTVLQALLIIDVDHFKAVNDTYGHMAGDNILSLVAEQMRSHVRSSDVVGRIGGDEFLVYLPEVETEEDALWKAQSLHAVLGTLVPEQGAPPITCSIGMAVFPHGTVEYADLYQYADTALYRCKDAGRNGVTVYRENEGAK